MLHLLRVRSKIKTHLIVKFYFFLDYLVISFDRTILNGSHIVRSPHVKPDDVTIPIFGYCVYASLYIFLRLEYVGIITHPRIPAKAVLLIDIYIRLLPRVLSKDVHHSFKLIR